MLKKESQNTEFKQSWRDEFLKTICAFANANGGTLFIGIDDHGKVIGLQDAKKLQEDIPNKIKDTLGGILPEVHLKREKSKEYLCVKIKPYQIPISCRGKYYIRSGSTTQELNGAELQKFLLRKSGVSWESVIEEGATIKDIDTETINRFKELVSSKHPNIVKEKSVSVFLEKLHLLNKRKLTRAAILLFGKDPQKFYAGSFIKIGRSENDIAVHSMDDIKGNLFQQAEETMEILKKKYLHVEIKIESLHREEDLEFPEVALREAVVNAIVHRDYSSVHSQIKVYPGSLSVWNNGALTNNLTIEKLKKKHPSFPRNERIADVFFKAGYIEAWGQGILKMIDECKKAGLPEPVYEELSGGVQVTFLKDIFNEEYLHKMMLNDRQIKAVLYIKKRGKINNSQYQQVCNTSKRTASNDLLELTEKGVIIRIGATGQGTEYILQRGNKGAKGAKHPKDDLDKKLMKLDEELSVIDPNEEIKVQLNKEIFFKILDSWLSELFRKLIPVAQKFNKLFNQPEHSIYTTNIIQGGGSVSFINENANEIVNKFIEECKKGKPVIYDNSKVEFNLRYGPFKKGGLNSFGCNFHGTIDFDNIKYRILLDEFSDNTMRNTVLQYERLLHKPITKEEIKLLAEKLGNSIYQHIDYYTKKHGLR